MIVTSLDPGTLPEPLVMRERGIWPVVGADPRVLDDEPHIGTLRRRLQRRADEEGRAVYLLRLRVVVRYRDENWLGDPTGPELRLADTVVCGASEPIVGWDAEAVQPSTERERGAA